MPDALAGLAASAALSVSDIPFKGPISEVRVARINGEFIINPTFSQLEIADMDIVVAATMENIVMVEGEMKEVSEEDLLNAMKAAHQAIKIQCQAQLELMKEVGKTEKRIYNHEENNEELKNDIWTKTYEKTYQIAISGNNDKRSRNENLEAIINEYIATLEPEIAETKKVLIDKYYHDVQKEAMRRAILDKGKRLDGRRTNEIRPIWCEVDYLPGHMVLQFLHVEKHKLW